MLTAAGAVPQDAAAGVIFLGELGLDGLLRPVHGVLPTVAATARAGFSTVVAAAENAAEAALVPGMTVVRADTLTQVIERLRGGGPADGAGPDDPGPGSAGIPRTTGTAGIAAPVDPGPSGGLTYLRGQPQARHAAEICAAGGHHLSLLTPPGTPATAVAAHVRDLLPGP